MAEVTGLRNNALPYPVYGVPYGITFPLLDADGDPVSPSSPDSEVSKNGDTFADCTNEATEIATSSGLCYLLLTAAEMTADVVTVRIQSTGAKTTVLTLYPAKLPVLASGTAQGSNDTGDIQLAAGASALDDVYNGCLVVATIDTVVEARIINDYVGSTKVAEVSPAFVTAQPDSDDTYTIYLPLGCPAPALPWLAADRQLTALDEDSTTIDLNATTIGTVTTLTNLPGITANWLTAAGMASDVATELAAPILAVLGALADGASDGDPTNSDTIVAYLKQIINTLEGSAGIPTFPSAAAPANAVSLAEIIRSIYTQVGVAGAGLSAIPGAKGQTLAQHVDWISAATHGDCEITGSGPYTFEYKDIAGNVVLSASCQDGERTVTRS